MAKAINLDNLQKFRQEYDKRLENGSVVPSKALTAKELETISQESGDTQETPFILQGTGTANGTSSVDTGTVGKHIQKQGSTYCVNQRVHFDKTVYTSGKTYREDELGFALTANTTETNYASPRLGLIAGHKYLIKATLTGTFSACTLWLNSSYTQNALLISNPVSIITASLDGNGTLTYQGESGASIILNVIDLTQWFNGNVPTSLTADNFSLYHNYGDYIPYNVGTLVSASGRYLVTTGYNQFDGVIESGTIYQGNDLANANYIRVPNNKRIRVLSGEQYTLDGTNSSTSTNSYLFEYDENGNWLRRKDKESSNINNGLTFTISNDCVYVRFVVDKNTTNICFHLTYDGSRTGYEPYVAPKVYDAGTETLLSTGVALDVSGKRTDIYDYKEPNGTITRRVGSYTFTGQETWTQRSTSGTTYRFSCDAISTLIKTPNSNDVKANVICGGYVIIADNSSGTYGENQAISITTAGLIMVYNANVQTSSGMASEMAGKTIYYELATPTTEQGTPFSENIEIDDFGTMGWYSAYTDSNTNTFVNVPQGCQIFYPAWYVGFIDTLGQREDIDWDANQIVSKGQLSSGDPKTLKALITLVEQNHAIEQENIGGALRHQLSDNDNALAFANTSFVDLGTLTWEVNSSYPSSLVRTSGLSSLAKLPSTNAETPKIICPKYRTIFFYSGGTGVTNTSLSISLETTGQLNINDSNLVGKTSEQIKSLLKGVLLAYEKA